jgi:hypothetical protein
MMEGAYGAWSEAHYYKAAPLRCDPKLRPGFNADADPYIKPIGKIGMRLRANEPVTSFFIEIRIKSSQLSV